MVHWRGTGRRLAWQLQHAVPGMVEAKSHSEWPSRGLSSGTPDPNRLACLGIRGEGGAQHAIEHTKPHPGYVPRFLFGGLVEPMLS